MMRDKTKGLLIILGIILNIGTAQAALVGHWTFKGSTPLADQTGNFPDLVLQGDASIVGGALDVNGTGTTATGWARTDPLGTYSGPTISSKTLVSRLILQSLYSDVYAGSALTINRVGIDYFDAIVFSEMEENRWLAGSTGSQRTQNFNPGFQETTVGQSIQIAITYEHLGEDTLRVTGYRNGQQIGQYTTGNASSWNTGDAEVFFGIRHILYGSPLGALDAQINEACIYNQALTQTQINQIRNGCIPNPSEPVPTSSKWGMVIFSVLMALIGISSMLMLRRRQRV
jgi:hypothetical protein